ncbi:MAG: DUF5686 and carboxypeptidase regulatory-like domain-containing protein [Saprospiraceae bacterium]|nr:DUF5686 and carboxypeptidase regulatory-like domain-containing protein [Saprospiraceae bacterium]
MLKRYTFLFLLGLCSNILFASGIKGTITDQNGMPLPSATIFIQKEATGTVSNEDGYYEINLTPGTYKVVYQFIGYETVVEAIVVTRGTKVTQDIILNEQTLELQTIEVLDGRENPAYTIMRKAIAKAEYHRQQIESYTAQIYIKGSGRLLKSPFLLRKAIEKEGIDSTSAFLVESVSEFSYQRPNTYKERVISIRKQGDDNSISPTPYINSSFYDPEIVSAVSPLSPRAFGYYKFELIGSYFERGVEINQIKVIPRSKGEGVYEGTISSVEDLWSIHSLKLKTYKLGISFEISQIYAPILETAWLPVTHQFFIDAKIFGFNFVYNYLATASDYKVELNPDLNVDFVVIDENIDKELAEDLAKKQKTKTGSIEEKIASGEELTRKDLRKMMKEYEKEDRKEQEEPKMTENRSMEIDSTAQNRDTAFWAKIRPVPLTKFEVKSYQKVDSLALVEVENDTIATEKSKKKKERVLGLSDIIFGKNYSLGKKTRLAYKGLLLNTQLNAVEGLALASELGVFHSLENKNELSYGIIPRFSFSREKVLAKGYIEYKILDKFRKGKIRLEGGRYVSEFNESGAISPLINSLYYIFGENYIKLYEKQFLSGLFEKRVVDGLSLNFHGEYARRHGLENSVDEGWFYKEKKEFEPNTPENIEIGNPPLETQDVFVVGGGLEWKPWVRYKINNGVKIFQNISPIFSLNYKKGLGDVDYDFIEVGGKYTWRRFDGSRMDIKLAAGSFLNNESLTLPDFKHFPGNQTILTVSDPVENFRLLDYYEYSTKDKYLQVHIHHQFRKLLLTQIPMVWMSGLKENAFVNYLATPNAQNYFELGYGLDNIFKIFRVELISSFQDFEYQELGFRISIASMIGVSSDDGNNSISISF